MSDRETLTSAVREMTDVELQQSIEAIRGTPKRAGNRAALMEETHRRAVSGRAAETTE